MHVSQVEDEVIVPHFVAVVVCSSYWSQRFNLIHRPMLLTTQSRPRGSYRTHTAQRQKHAYPCPHHVVPTGPILFT